MPLAELDYDHTLHQNRYAMDKKLYVRFFTAVQPDEERSVAEGRKCFKDAEMVQIMVPGDKKNIIIREARREDKQRFAELYERWARDKSNDSLDGYPLSEWSGATPSIAEELRYFGFRTVEHVASANDAVCSKFPGLHELKRRAQGWLEMREKQAPLEAAQAELAKRDEMIATLNQQMKEMGELLREMRAKA